MKNVIANLIELEHKYRGYSISEEFHDKTRVTKITKVLPANEWPEEWLKIYFKGYPRLNRIPLGRYDSPKMKTPYLKVLSNRVSSRNFDENFTLTKHQLSTLLYYSGGIRTKFKGTWDKSRRFYPSPGARYALEIYPVIIGESEIEKGVYHYNVKQHTLEILKLGDFSKVTKKLLNQSDIKNVNVLFFITAVFGRNLIKYRDRGYRFILIENGHLGQNIYLTSTAMELGCCALGAYPDTIINNLLDVDGEHESVVNAIAIGLPKK